MLYCNTVTVAATRRAGAGLGAQALGWACRRARRRQSAGARGSRRGAQVGRRWGAQAGMRGRARRASGTAGRARRAGSWAAGARAVGRGARAAGHGRRAAWELGERPGHAGWPGLCTPLGF